MSRETANIAKCEKHGLHGERDVCFECGEVVTQIAMTEVREDEMVVSIELLERILPNVAQNDIASDNALRHLMKMVAKEKGEFIPDFTQDVIDELRGMQPGLGPDRCGQALVEGLIGEGWTWTHETEEEAHYEYSLTTDGEIHKGLSELLRFTGGSHADHALAALNYLSSKGRLKSP